MPWWASLIKSLPALSRAFVHLRLSFKNRMPLQYLAASGFFASAVGDFVLGPDRNTKFLVGLGSFLIGHIFFSAAMLSNGKGRITQDLREHRLLIAGLLGVLLVFYFVLCGYLGPMLVPVTLYMIAIAVMGSLAFSKNGDCRKYFVRGAAFFVCSDILIAFDKFIVHVPLRGTLILLTYYLAIFGLSSGFTHLYADRSRS